MRRAVLGFTLIALVSGLVYAQTGQVAIQTWKGTLVDANCAAGSGSTGASASSAGATASTQATEQNEKATNAEQSNASDRPSKKGHRDRSASQTQSCSVTSSATAFALMTADGHTLKFDSVGNMRVAEELKTNQKWVKEMNEGKPVHTTVSGTMSGEMITATSIH
jgi:hypothetical protein